MADKAETGNDFRGTAGGSVVQARTIGHLVLSMPPAEGRLPVPRQLPAAVPDFTGRTGETAALDSLLSEDGPARGVAVVDGTAGVGKTALVVRWAHRAQHRFPDGTLFVNLRGYGPSAPLAPVQVLAGFVTALGVAEKRIPSDPDALTGLYRSVLAQRRVLVVLDNAGTTDQVRPLLPGAPGCLVLVSSRARLTGLGVAVAARHITLGLLPPREAEVLVRGVIGAARADAEPGAVAELIEVCARLPLALRIAATRLAVRRHLAVADIVEDIAEETAVSGDGDEADSVRGVFDWSYAHLPGGQARTFRRLGLHPGPEFGVPAAAALTGLPQATAYRHLEALAETHMVEVVGRKRYRFHDLLHTYAAAQSASHDSERDRRDALDRVLTWYARTALAADRLVFPVHAGIEAGVDGAAEMEFADRARALAWLNAEQTNLMAALRSAVECRAHGPALGLAGTARFLVFRERAMWPVEAEAESLGISVARTCGDRAAEAFLLACRCETFSNSGRWADAEADCARLLVLARELNDLDHQQAAFAALGFIRLGQGRYPEARACYLRALPLARRTGATRWEAVVECNLSEISARLGDYERALDHAHRELGLRRRIADHVGEAFALHNLAVAWRELGQAEAGLECAMRAVELNRSLEGTDHHTALVLETAASCLESMGDLSRAGQYLRDACAILTEFGDPRAETVRDALRGLESRAAPDAGNAVQRDAGRQVGQSGSGASGASA
ncbi:ATP-binding protein [Amycolatopsis pigmentata]|uniref:ATP-binding protein n=1 Tax=Amycolatopsis pigmentata TaxID=450801 RepID=A0ABW5FM29_9PSEU